MEQKDFREMLKRYLSGCAPEHEIEIVEKWYRDMALRSGNPTDADEPKLEEQYLTNIMGHVKKRQQVKMLSAATGLRLSPLLGIAASLLLIVATVFVFTTKTVERKTELAAVDSSATVRTDFLNASDVPLTCRLPDGSTVTLQPNSNIKLLTLFNTATRELQLEGEAFFDIVPNKSKPFVVYANDITTKVLGTSFTVRSFRDDKQVKVAVKTGTVSVLTNAAATQGHAKETVLTPNQEMVYHRAAKIVERRIVDTPQPIVANEELEPMRFEDAPLNQIVEAIEKIYGVKIEYDETRFASCVLTTSLSGRGLFNRMNVITSAIGATYELKEDRIVIRGTGCNHHQK